MSLFGKFNVLKKHKKSTSISFVPNVTPTHNSLGEPLNQLDGDGELPFGWTAYHPELKNYESEIVQLALKARKFNDVDSRVKSYKKLIEKFYEYKNYCYNKDECYKKYFDENYLHCHNSTSSDFSYIQPFEQELEDILNNYEQRTKECNDYKDCQEFLQNKTDEIFSVIQCTPGILQKELKKKYDQKYNSCIDTILFKLVENNKIVKERKGNSNKLYTK